MSTRTKKQIFTLVLEYNDGSDAQVEIITEGQQCESLALLLMICRGTLMLSSAKSCTIYDTEGIDVISYSK